MNCFNLKQIIHEIGQELINYPKVRSLQTSEKGCVYHDKKEKLFKDSFNSLKIKKKEI